MVVIGQIVLYSGKIGCIWAKVVCNRANMVVIGQSLLYSEEVFLFLH